MDTSKRNARVRCVGGVVRDPDDRLLLIRRARPPGQGLWSLPGGRVEEGESDEEALVREVREETGLTVRVGAPVGSIERAGPASTVFDIHDYAATVAGGTLVPGDDASEARWVTAEEMPGLALTEGLAETLAGWEIHPGRRQDPR